jgi:hypothetical protein
MTRMTPEPEPDIAGVVEQLQVRIDTLPAGLAKRRAFLETYRRITAAVGRAVTDGVFEDPAWVTRWDVTFAGLFLAVHDADLAHGDVPRPWRLAYEAPDDLPVLRHLLLQLNAHVNYDLPRAMMAVLPEQDFASPVLLQQRRRDHERIDTVLASRMAVETRLNGLSHRFRDWVLGPANRWSSRRFLRRSRQDVWNNLGVLQQARAAGVDAYEQRLRELDVLTSAKIAELVVPGPILLRLAVTGFGVRLPPEKLDSTP